MQLCAENGQIGEEKIQRNCGSWYMLQMRGVPLLDLGHSNFEKLRRL